MKDFRKTPNWKKFTEEFPIGSDNSKIIVWDKDDFGKSDHFIIGYIIHDDDHIVFVEINDDWFYSGDRSLDDYYWDYFD